MDNNAPGHAAKVTREKLTQLGIEHLPWPPASPDLNPIENIWQIMKQKYEKTNHPLQRYSDYKKQFKKNRRKLIEFKI